METTDLNEIVWQKNGGGFSLKLPGAEIESNIQETCLLPVPSPAIGIYRASLPGKSADFKDGELVAKNQNLGYVEAGKEHQPVLCSDTGYIRAACVEDGKTVQYGQPLFFIERK